jgi:hypothetical protein
VDRSNLSAVVISSIAAVMFLYTVPVGLADDNQPGTLQATPERIQFESPESSAQVLLIWLSPTEIPHDVTHDVSYSTTRGGIVSVDERGRIVPLAEGTTQVVARLNDSSIAIDVEVADLTAPPPISYHGDVIPILSKAGCNSGGCHGKAEGQNGFKLSVFGYDARSDHQALISEGRGRRVMPTAPDQSLLLRKATGSLPHGGGQKVEPATRWYRQLRRWIAEGATLDEQPRESIMEIQVEPSRVTLPAHGRQQLRVTVYDWQGQGRCVTAETQYESNHNEVADVDPEGLVVATNVPGEAAILVRYLGHVAVCRVTRPQPSPEVIRLAERNFIDRHVGEKLAELGIQPSEPATDAEFLRRVYLDTIGTLPTPQEARRFLLDDSPVKRQRLVDELLERPEYADFWAQQWSDLLQIDVDTIAPPATVAMVRWLHNQLVENVPYDQFVRSILTSRGLTTGSTPSAFYQIHGDPEQLARSVSQLFLGVRIECAQCHHHPFERWDQRDYVALAGFFTGIERRPSPPGGQKIVARAGYDLPHPRTGEPVPTAGLGASPAELDHVSDRRQLLADWMTDRENYWFPRTIVNRLWAHYFGRGLVEPVDDLRVTNPASNELLMDALVDHLLEVEYDLKAVTRILLDSQVYQLSSRPNTSNQLDQQSHSRAAWKPLPAEVLLDAISQATEIPEDFTGWPTGYRAIQVWDNKLPSHFLEIFGRPSRQTVCACERGTEPSMAQALHLMNSDATLDKVHHPRGRAARLAASDLTWDDVVDELYLATLSRFPTQAERSLAGRVLLEVDDRREATEDLLWTLMNMKEFVFNP